MMNPTPVSNPPVTQDKNSPFKPVPRDRTPRDPKGVVCFKCHGHGHITVQEWDVIREMGRPKSMLVNRNGKEEIVGPCTNSDDPDGTYVVGDDGEVEPIDDTDVSEEEERETVYPEHERQHLLIRRNFHATPKINPNDQRENIFQTKCKIKDKICDLIIDGGSESNCVSKDLVNTLGLETKNHPHPYKLKWLDNKASGFVKKRCLVQFAIGSYTDKVLCDVLDMTACHVLLGRPWQHDKKTIHNGYTNVYTLRHEGKLKDLMPLPPHKTLPPQTNKTSVALISRKVSEKVIKRGERAFLLFNKEVRDQAAPIDPKVTKLLERYADVFPEELPKGLPPIRGIKH